MNKKVETIVQKLKDDKKVNSGKINSARGVGTMKKVNYSGRLHSSSGKEVIKENNSGKVSSSQNEEVIRLVDVSKLVSTSAGENVKKPNSDKSDSDEEVSKTDNSHGKCNFRSEEISRKANYNTAKTSPNRVYHRQHYRKLWETLPEFSGWLEADPKTPLRAFCRVCNKNLHAHRLTLLKHTASIKHTKQAQIYFEKKSILKRSLMAMNKLNKTPTDANKNGDVQLANSEDNGKDKQDNNASSIANLSQDDFNENISDEPDSAEQVTPMIQDENPAVEKEDLIPPPTVVMKPPISTHVLDTSRGLPVPGLPVSLYKLVDGRWNCVNEAYTNPDGRCADLITRDNVEPGRFKLHFDTDKYYDLRKNDRLYPFIEIVFDLRSPTEHIHIPLLMTPYGYTTYKGS